MTTHLQTPPDLLPRQAGPSPNGRAKRPLRAAAAAVLACPVCHSEIRIDTEEVVCSACGRTWPRHEGGAPLFTRPAGQDADDPSGVAADDGTGVRDRLRRAVAPPTFGLDLATTDRTAKLKRRVMEAGGSGGLLNVGCGPALTDSIQQLGPDLLHRTVHLDVTPHSDLVDLVADAGSPWPIKTGSLDAIISTAVLCYLEDPRVFAAESARCLAPGGLLLVTVPFMQPQMEDTDCMRWTLPGLVRLFDQLEPLELAPTSGPATVLGKALMETLAVATTLPCPRLWGAARSFWGWLLWPMKYLDAVLSHHPRCAIMSSALVLMATKPGPRA